ncbi:Inorganic pyrophosphatase 2, partial [Glycine soja]
MNCSIGSFPRCLGTLSHGKLLICSKYMFLIDKMMMELHSHEKIIEGIVQVLQRIPIHPRITGAIKAAHVL